MHKQLKYLLCRAACSDRPSNRGMTTLWKKSLISTVCWACSAILCRLRHTEITSSLEKLLLPAHTVSQDKGLALKDYQENSQHWNIGEIFTEDTSPDFREHLVWTGKETGRTVWDVVAKFRFSVTLTKC